MTAPRAGVAESADASVSNTDERKLVWVQVPPPAPLRQPAASLDNVVGAEAVCEQSTYIDCPEALSVVCGPQLHAAIASTTTRRQRDLDGSGTVQGSRPLGFSPPGCKRSAYPITIWLAWTIAR